jgi:hypothetical protein
MSKEILEKELMDQAILKDKEELATVDLADSQEEEKELDLIMLAEDQAEVVLSMKIGTIKEVEILLKRRESIQMIMKIFMIIVEEEASTEVAIKEIITEDEKNEFLK